MRPAPPDTPCRAQIPLPLLGQPDTHAAELLVSGVRINARPQPRSFPDAAASARAVRAALDSIDAHSRVLFAPVAEDRAPAAARWSRVRALLEPASPMLQRATEWGMLVAANARAQLDSVLLEVDAPAGRPLQRLSLRLERLRSFPTAELELEHRACAVRGARAASSRLGRRPRARKE